MSEVRKLAAKLKDCKYARRRRDGEMKKWCAKPFNTGNRRWYLCPTVHECCIFCELECPTRCKETVEVES